MLNTRSIAWTTSRPTAVIRLTIPRDEIQRAMGPGLAELRAAISTQGISPSGPWFTYHLRMDPNIFDFEIGIPVATPVVALGRVQAGQLVGTCEGGRDLQGGGGTLPESRDPGLQDGPGQGNLCPPPPVGGAGQTGGAVSAGTVGEDLERTHAGRFAPFPTARVSRVGAR